MPFVSSLKGIVSRIYINTPPPCLLRSYRIRWKPLTLISSSEIDSLILDSLVAKISRGLFSIITQSLSMCVSVISFFIFLKLKIKHWDITFIYKIINFQNIFVRIYNKHTCREVSPGLELPATRGASNPGLTEPASMFGFYPIHRAICTL
jgi:hypothetical protein